MLHISHVATAREMVPAVLRLARIEDVELASACLQPVSGDSNALIIQLELLCRVPPQSFRNPVVHQPTSAVDLTHAVPGSCTPVPDNLHEIIGLVLGVRAWGNRISIVCCACCAACSKCNELLPNWAGRQPGQIPVVIIV